MAAVMIALAACGIGPTSMQSIDEKIAWTGQVFAARDPALVAELLDEDAARRLVSDYDPELEVIALHAGELSPNVSGPSYLGYVVEAMRSGDPELRILLINAEEGELAAGPGTHVRNDGQ